MRISGHSAILSAAVTMTLLAALAAPVSAQPLNIAPGSDLWTTPPGVSSLDFSSQPIPADFFGPGSDPFDGQVALEGEPLAPSSLGETDAIVERLTSAALTGPGSSATVDIEIVALSLRSTAPITVTFDGGQNPTEWDVDVCLSETATQQTGQMTIIQDCADGGIFFSDLPVTAKLVFTQVNPPGTQQAVLDPLGPEVLIGEGGHWSTQVLPPFQITQASGNEQVDHDCNPNTPLRPVAASSGNFFPGFRLVPCTPDADPICGGKTLTQEQAQLAAHGVLPPQDSLFPEGACCLPDLSCIITDRSCCAALSGTYQGDGTICTTRTCVRERDCFESIGQATVTLDPNDPDCLEGASIDLTSVFDNATIVALDPPPYQTGQVIQTEILSLSLRGSDPGLGEVIIRESPTKQSLGQVVVISVDPDGQMTSGDSFFDVWVEVDIPSAGQQLENETALRLEAELRGLPPLGSDYFPPPTAPPARLLDRATGIHVGWLCHSLHRPTIEVPCDQPRPVGACCLPGDTCAELTEGRCKFYGGQYQGDGTLCSQVTCPPEKDEDCFESVAQGTVTLDPADDQCVNGVQLSLSSILSPATKIEVDPPPYSDGVDIQTEIVQMELSASDGTLGDVIIRERADKASLGEIQDVITDGQGNFVSGESFFDVFIEVEIVQLGLVANTGNIPFHLEASITELPPVDSVYFPPPSAAPLKLFDRTTGEHIGWLCHAEHQPTIPVPCDTVGACCLPDNTCTIATAADCQAQGGTYQGDYTSCVPNPCITPCTQWTAGVDTIPASTFEIELFAPDSSVQETLFAAGTNMVVQRGAPYEFATHLWRMDDDLLQLTGAGNSPLLGSFFIELDPSMPSTGAITQCDSCNDHWAESFFDVFFVIVTTLSPPMDTLRSDPAHMVLPCSAGWDPGDPFTPPYGHSYNDPRLVPIFDNLGNLIGYIKKRHRVYDSPQSGACCIGDNCMVTTLDSCAAQQGTYHGDGSVCVPNPCVVDTGACCDTVSGDCFEATQAGCEDVGGVYQGDGTTCDQNPCQGCCDIDGIRGDADDDCTFGCVNVADLSFVVAFLFQDGPRPVCCDEANADGDCTFGCINVADLSHLVAFLFEEGQPPDPCNQGHQCADFGE